MAVLQKEKKKTFHWYINQFHCIDVNFKSMVIGNGNGIAGHTFL